MNLLLFLGGDGSSYNGTIMLAIFDVIIMAIGLYSMRVASQMKKTGVPPEWLVPASTLKKMKRKKEFCDEMAPKTIIFGVLCLIYGVYGLIAVFVIGNYWARVAGVVLFLIFLIWYFMELQKIRDLHL
ncbi:MAG: hypothetical protein LUC41_02355 [Clostridiales bacterium]|nr:hypothetical protein [Clostridiales bacterium]